jgi:hypothetical protein
MDHEAYLHANAKESELLFSAKQTMDEYLKELPNA